MGIQARAPAGVSFLRYRPGITTSIFISTERCVTGGEARKLILAGEAPEGLQVRGRLDLTNTGITGAGMAHLKGLNNLRALGLWKTQVDDAGLAHIGGLTKMWLLVLMGKFLMFIRLIISN